jgi:autotransporter-associated beta strand protein
LAGTEPDRRQARAATKISALESRLVEMVARTPAFAGVKWLKKNLLVTQIRPSLSQHIPSLRARHVADSIKFAFAMRYFYYCLFYILAISLHGGQTVVDAGSTFTFSVPAIATNYAWRLEGTLVSTNGIVGTNGPNYTYAPTRFDVGTHELACFQTLSNGVSSNTFWQVRVRIPLPTPATSYYVATNGSDANTGSISAPFLTLECARNAIRTNGLPTGGVTVYLRGGTYFRTNTFVLTNLDSGTMTSPVIYASYPGETAVLSAGKPIPAASFVPLDASQTNRVAPGINPTNILELDLKTAGITHTNPFPKQFGTWVTTNIYQSSGSGGICELFFNGKRQWLSRYPNHDLTNDNLNTPFMLMNGVAQGLVTVTNSYTGTFTNYLNSPGLYTNSAGQAVPVGCAFHYYPSDDTEVAKWLTALTNGGVWVSGFWRVQWGNDAIQVVGIDLTNRVIEITNTVSVSLGIGDKYSRPQGSFQEPYWVMNLLEDMDQPGEWAIDFRRNKLYFYSPTNQLADGSVVISDLDSPIVQLTQTTNVIFKSLVFEVGLAQGILIGTNCQNNLVVGCTLRNMNNYPVDINGGYTNGVVSCLMQDLAGGGVFLRGGNESSSPRVPACDFVVNNIITNSGVIARIYATPIDCGFGGEIGGGGGGHTQCVGMRVAHNLITVAPHVGILHGSWDNTFEYNDLGFDGQSCNGISVIYSYDLFGRCGNDNIRYNFIHDSAQEGALGFDGDHWNEHIYGNLANRTPAGLGEGAGATQTTPGHEQPVDFYNNLTVNNTQVYGGIGVATPIPALLEENAAIFCSTPFPVSLVTPGVNVNTITTSTIAAIQSGPNLTYTSDPGFINLPNNDLRLVPNSTVYTDMPKFGQIPFEMIGLYNDETWSNATGYAPYPTTAPVSQIGPGSATLNGALVYPQFDVNSTVFVYWGTNDGGANPSAWTNVISLGIQGAGNLSTNLTGLAHVPYFYRFFATNASGQAWATTSTSFTPYPTGHIPVSVTWKGDGTSNVWNGVTNNFVWLNGGLPDVFWDGDTVTFDNTGSNSLPVNLTAVVQPAFVGINATKNYTFSGAGKISGTTALQKDGSGTLILLTTNDYTGSTTINSGTLQVGNGAVSGALGSGNITNNATLVFNQPDNTTVSGIISGSGGVMKTGGGVLTLAANNVYTGTTTISGGAVAIAADANLGASGAGLLFDGGALQITSGGLFTFNNRAVTMNPGGGIINSATTLTITNPIAGSGALTLTGGGTTILTASNTYAGSTIVSAGLLQIDNGGGTGSVATNIVLSGGDLLYTRPDNFVQRGFISSSSTNSSINNLATSGQLTLTFAAGSNTLGSVINSSSNVFVLGGGSNYFLPFGTDLANVAANQTLVLTNGYWFTPRIGANGGPYMLGTNVIANATLETSSARGVRGNFQIQNGGVLRLNSAHYPGAVNENRFDFGNTGMSAGETTSITISSGGTLDIWTLQYDGFNFNPTTANTVANVVQNGGTALVGINGTSNSVKNVVFNAAATNTFASYQLNGGLLKVAGTISATAPAAGGTNLFSFTGGTLAAGTINATNLFVTPTNSLVNLGGTLAPGDAGTPGATFIQGNYVCSSAATLAIDIGGTNRANAFVNATNYYDFVGVSGTATLAGNLNVSLLNNFVPAATNSFTILTNSSGLSGAFANVTSGRVPVANYSGGSFAVVTSATSVVLTNFQTMVAVPPVISGIQISGGNLIITGTNGTTGANYYVLTATNLALPMTNWSILSTQQFGPGGALNFTNPVGTNTPQLFYRLRLP